MKTKTPTTDNRVATKAGRMYEIDGESYPSVTTILQIIGKPALVNWAAKVERELVCQVACELYADAPATPKMSPTGFLLTLNDRLGKEKAHKRELEKAGEIGSQVHALIEWTLRAELMHKVGPSPRICDKAQWAFMAWEDWRKSVKLKPIFVEQVVYSNKYGYAGTLDLFAEINGIPTVVDWKSGKAVYPEAHLQNAAYRAALREMGHGDADAGLIVRLPKVETDPEFEVVEAKPELFMFPKFLDALSVWKWAQMMESSAHAPASSDLVPQLQKSIEQVQASR